MSASLSQDGDLWILTLNGGDKNFLTLPLVNDIHQKIDTVTRVATSSGRVLALVTVVGANYVSFSEGVDYNALRGDDSEIQQIENRLREVVRKLLEIPARTYALLSGLTSSMGLVFAMAHDYVGAMHDAKVQMKEVMTEGRQLPAFAMRLLEERVGNRSLLRRLALSDEMYPTDDELGKKIDLHYAGLADAVSYTIYQDLVEETKTKARDQIRKLRNPTNYVNTRKRLLKGVAEAVQVAVPP